MKSIVLENVSASHAKVTHYLETNFSKRNTSPLGQKQKLPKHHISIHCAHFGETEGERERESLVVRCWLDTVMTKNNYN